MINSTIPPRLYYSLKEAEEKAHCDPRSLLAAGQRGEIVLCVIFSKVDSSIYEVDPLSLPNARRSGFIPQRFTYTRQVKFEPETEIDRLILSPNDCADILRSGVTFQHAFNTAYKVVGNELWIIPDQTVEESKIDEPIVYDDLLNSCDEPSDVKIPPPPKLIWHVCELDIHRDVYSTQKKIKQLRIDESNVQISASELQGFLSKNVNKCIHQKDDNKVNKFRADFPRKLLILMTIYLDSWGSVVKTLSDGSSCDRSNQKQIVSSVEAEIREKLKSHKKEKLFESESILSGCIIFLRPDILRKSQETNLKKISFKSVSGDFNSPLNLLIKIAEEMNLSEGTPENTPNNGDLSKTLEGYGLSQKMAEHGATILRPLSKSRGRPKKIKNK